MSNGRGGRPTKEQSRAGTEAEVVRLYRLGREIGEKGKQGTICGMLDIGRSAVYEILKKANSTPSAALAMKEERRYQKQSGDEFLNEPAIKEWVADLRLRRIGQTPELVSRIRRMCEELQIYPDQLVPFQDGTGKRDFTWAQKWLASKSDISLDKLRHSKLAYRAFAKKFGATDYELTMAGFDAKHYGVGKWKTVQMSDAQMFAVESYLAHPSRAEIPGERQALFAFRFGIETCRTREPIYALKADQFYTLQDAKGTTLHCANVFRKKTEKSGAPYKTAYVAEATYNLAKELGGESGGPVMDGISEDTVNPILRAAYQACGVHARDPEWEGDPAEAPDYFQLHPIHALRHAGAMRLLRLTNYNRAVVAELGGWEAEKTLEDHYGGVPQDVVRAVVGSIL